jgi:hypothetical protein
MSQLSGSVYVRNLVHTACSRDQPRRGAQGRFDAFAKPSANEASVSKTVLFSEPDARPLAVLVDEDHAGLFQRRADCDEVARRQRPATVLKVGDGVSPDYRSARQFGLTHIDESAGGAALRRQR